MSDETKYTLQSLLAAPKGNLNYTPGDAFMLHVFWEAPSIEAARELLTGLRQCAAATHRDTPCVPSYLFRISNSDTEICSPPPRTLEDHPHIRAALRKLQVGVPFQAVRTELAKRRLDPSFIDDPENVNLSTPLPETLQTQPVRVEFTEIYLDERAFMEHAGSRDYLDGHGVVMNPALHYTTPITVRLGTPPARIVEGILEPILNENVAPVPEGCTVWQHPPSGSSSGNGSALFMSLDVTDISPDDVVSRLPSDFRDHCTTFVAFAHPLRAGTTRIMCVLPSLPSLPILTSLAALQVARGEVHMDSDDSVQCVRDALVSAGIGNVSVNASEKVGYVLHERAADVRTIDS